jgi:hypothetical protein
MRAGPNPIPAWRRRRRLALRLPAALVLVLVLAPALWACGSDGGQRSGLPGTTGSGGPALPGDVLVRFDTSGTITGQGIGAIEVAADGEVRYTGVDGTVESRTLTPHGLDELTGLLDSTDFGSVPAETDVEDRCPDALIVIVTYQRWEVSADDCTIPAELEPVVDRLRDLMARFT